MNTKEVTTGEISMKDKWAIQKLNVEGFDAIAMINKAYVNFNKKDKFPFLLSVEISLVDTVNELPTEMENERLADIEEELLKIFRKTQEVQYIGHITRKGWRDILCYIASENLDGNTIGKYCDSIEEDRNINIETIEDIEWETVDVFLE
jgi:hypothetical protein